MASPVIPVIKAIYLCDDVLADATSNKIHLIGMFNTVRPSPSSAYPFRLRKVCVFAQLADGLGDVPVHVEIVHVATETVVYNSGEQVLHFPSRQATVSACFRISNCQFPAAGLYLVELYCQGTFVDDRVLQLIALEGTES